MADRVGIGKTLCMVHGNVKHTSMEGTSKFKTGNLELAVSESGQVVCIVNYAIGPSKKFVLTNQIKGIITNQQRCVINLKNGTNINYRNNNKEIVDDFIQILEELKLNKKEPRHSTTTVMGIHSTPNGQAFTPVKQSPGNSQKTRHRTKLGPVTPRSSLKFTPKKSPMLTPARTSPNPMTTPSHLRSTIDCSAAAENAIFNIKDEDDSDGGTVEHSPLLFTDMPYGGKENVEHQNYRIPKYSERQKSAFQMRKEEGGSVFMASFQEKQLLLEERKENTAPKPVSNASAFYSRGRQIAGYCATDALLQSRQTNSNVTVKRTPGFLSVSNSKRLYPITSYPGWRQKSIPTAVKTSQISLQGFSNLGNTCYMNAILQSLFCLECFTADMQNQDIIPLMQKSSLYWALAQLLCAKQSNHSAESIGVYLRKVKQAISTTAARFSGFMQHDAQEFLCQCLDQLKDDTERANKRALNSPLDETPGTDDDKMKLRSRYPHACPIVKNFEFEVMHSITCKQCGEVVTKAEQFYDLSLDMPRRSHSNPIGSIQTALEQFFKEEGIEYACGECDCKQATVTHKFTKLPRVIIIHLKRYRFDADAFQYSKLRRRILIPRYLSVHYHCTKETQSPTSLPKSLVNGTSSPRPQQLNAERTQRLSLTAPSARESNWSARSESFKPSRFSFTPTALSRKRLNYDDNSKQPRQTILLESNTDSDGEETKKVLEMSKKESERKKREADERLRLEEEELKKVLEESKQEIVHSKPIAEMSEEQQLEYALALSSRDLGSLNHQNGFVFSEDDTSKMTEDVSYKKSNNAKDFVEISEEYEVVLPSLKRRGSEQDILLQEHGGGDGVNVNSLHNASCYKRRKSDSQPSNHSSPSEHPLSAGDSGICFQEEELKIESSRTPSSRGPFHGLKKTIVNLFSPIKQSTDDIAVNLDSNQTDTPKSRVNLSLVDSNSADISRNEDDNTLQIGESDGQRPSYEELKAKEEEELRKATELSLQDAQEMAKEEEDALKRAKEISLQEFSESFSSHEDNDLEPMEIDDDSDETLSTELTENAEKGHLPSSYRLVSVVSHMGSTSSIGHYISDVYNRTKNSWLSYDDSQVVRTSEAAVRKERERSGYIFFYIAKS